MNSEFVNKKVVIWILASIMFIEMLDTTIINTAIPDIANSFKTHPVNLKFAVTSYLLSLAVFIPISGWAADRFGTKVVLSFAIIIFTLSSALCGFASSLIELSVFRFLQGFGGALMTPVGRLIMVRIFPPAELIRATMLIFFPALLGPIAGPLLGGVITTYTSWRLIFFINIPMGIASYYLVQKFIPNEIGEQKKKLDLTGFLLSGISLACLTVSLESIGENIIPSKLHTFLSTIGFFCFLLFIYHALRMKEKSILNLSLFKIKTFRIGVIGNSITYIATGGVAFLLPLLFQLQFGMTPLKSGLLVAPMAVGAIIMRGISPRILKNFGFKRVLSLAPIGIFLALICISNINQTSSLVYIIFSTALLGFFNILAFSSNGPMIYVDVPKNISATATSLDVTIRQFSNSISIGFSSFILLSFLNYYSFPIHNPNAVISFHFTFIILAFCILPVSILSLVLNKTDGEHATKDIK
ncbi:DHA2 family efflux MFS transporter permease subunit [Fluviispira multicolorata]|uniref:DHA2 family efflux MFS transporter permease subunit n=1 Tax=Fluviispira multicolorata TaxID=2654512 RepID=A0A833JBU5_9BACT|nr:DHA2 family efflux MFS transporter permease subunit [Fluviispira multicolorata]KAB8029158.1 DHA2 family efflux MFS transporter permease subunit [Fluviispira multicolorata]